MMVALAMTAANPSPPVLGVDAAPELKRWVSGLRGLNVTQVPIEAHGARVKLDRACALLLSHRTAPRCDDSTLSGETAICWSGARCPSAQKRARALNHAGQLRLPWRIPSGDHMATDGSGADDARRGLVNSRLKAQERLDVMDHAGAKSVLSPLLRDPALGPRDLLSILTVLAHVGASREAFEVTQREAWSALPLALRVLAHVSLTMGEDASVWVAPIVLDKDQACAATALGSGFVMTRDFRAAGALMTTLRSIDPACVEAYATEIEAYSELEMNRAVEAAWTAGREKIGDHPRLQGIETIVMKSRGEIKRLVATLEGQVAAGDHSPGLMKRLLALYVTEGLRTDKMNHWLRRARAEPNNTVAAFFAGILLHYERDWSGSNALLDRAFKDFSEEPRLYIYRAMNLFNLGDRAGSEAAITRSEELEVQDPDVFYCQGEIFRDTDRPRAKQALEVYWHQTRLSSDPNSKKQRRVRGLIDAIDRCMATQETGPCEGPWEHIFDSGDHRPSTL